MLSVSNKGALPSPVEKVTDPKDQKSPDTAQKSEDTTTETQAAITVVEKTGSKNDTKKSDENLSPDELMKCVSDTMSDLKNHTTYDNKEVLALLQTISKLYFKYPHQRKAIGNRLTELGFTEQVIKMMNWYNEVGVFKTDDTWFPTYYSYNICWNFSDACRELALSLGNGGLVKICTSNITHQPYIENNKSKNVTYMLKASLSILQNIAKLFEMTPVFEEENVKDALKLYLSHENEFFRAVATMILTSIISEEENSRLQDTGSIEFIVKAIRLAVTKNKNRRYRGFSVLELVECLGRMAVNDENKKKIVSLDALPLLVLVLKDDDEEEQFATARTLWTLAFDKEVRENIKTEPECVETLETRSNGSNARVKKAAKGALWMLKEKSETSPQAETTTEETTGHIFISYSWSQQSEIVQIKDALKASGYKVWIDMEQMGGSTLESMARAVENAAVVLICASADYKDSPNCRTEAEYTFQLKKPIIPLVLQRKYKADGWLGMIMGAKLYMKFDGKYPFKTAFSMLEKELQGRGKVGARFDTVDGPVVKQVATTTASQPSKEVPSSQKQSEVSTWSKDEVSKWLEKFGLDSKKQQFSNYDGSRFAQLMVIRHEVPQLFYRHLEEKLCLDLFEMSSLTLALDSLP